MSVEPADDPRLGGRIGQVRWHVRLDRADVHPGNGLLASNMNDRAAKRAEAVQRLGRTVEQVATQDGWPDVDSIRRRPGLLNRPGGCPGDCDAVRTGQVVAEHEARVEPSRVT